MGRSAPYQPGSPSPRKPSSAYSISRSLTERPRRSASAASLSASSVGMTTVRRTQSSLSQTSLGVSDKLPPLGHDPGSRRSFLERDVPAQDPIAHQAQATQIGKARALSEPCQHRHV